MKAKIINESIYNHKSKTYFSKMASEFISSILFEITPLLEENPFFDEINYNKCEVKILHNDFRTVWVKYGKYDCELTNLPIQLMATIADNIIKKN